LDAASTKCSLTATMLSALTLLALAPAANAAGYYFRAPMRGLTVTEASAPGTPSGPEASGLRVIGAAHRFNSFEEGVIRVAHAFAPEVASRSFVSLAVTAKPTRARPPTLYEAGQLKRISMTFPLNSTFWLLCALAFAGIAFAGEFVALSQMRRHAYRFVPLVRMLRRGQYLALLCTMGFIASSAYVNTRGTLTAATLGLLVGGTLAVPMLLGRQGYPALLRLVTPVVMLFVVVFNAEDVGAAPTLGLGWPLWAAAAALCGLLWLVAEYRHLQNMERWRD
jgi:hypothetical protein